MPTSYQAVEESILLDQELEREYQRFNQHMKGLPHQGIKEINDFLSLSRDKKQKNLKKCRFMGRYISENILSTSKKRYVFKNYPIQITFYRECNKNPEIAFVLSHSPRAIENLSKEISAGASMTTDQISRKNRICSILKAAVEHGDQKTVLRILRNLYIKGDMDIYTR